MIKHHRQQHWDMHVLRRCIVENFWRMRNQIDYVRADQRQGAFGIPAQKAIGSLARVSDDYSRTSALPGDRP
jgi:hypothetical protein